MKQININDDVYNQLELMIKEECVLKNPTVNQISAILSGVVEEACTKYLNEWNIQRYTKSIQE